MMKTIKRWSSFVVASVDRMVTQVENHESLVNAAIREVQETGARARVQIQRVKQDGLLMRKRLEELKREQVLWEERALKVADADQQKALECLKRKKKIEKTITELETREREHAKHEKQLALDLGAIDDRLQQLKQQRNMFRSRQARAEALKALQGGESVILSEIDEIFDRWETKIGEYEAPTFEMTDELEQEFVGGEETAALGAELEALRTRRANVTNA